MTYTLKRDDAPLAPGVYYFYFDAPERIKRAVASRPDWTQEAVRKIVERSNAEVEFLGSGLTHLTLESGQRTLYGVKLRLLPPGGLQTQQALVVTAVLVAAALGTTIYVTRTWSSVSDQWIGYLQENADNADDLTGATEDVAASARLFGWAAILFGGAALAYAVSRFR